MVWCFQQGRVEEQRVLPGSGGTLYSGVSALHRNKSETVDRNTTLNLTVQRLLDRKVLAG
jgi:hypothetical protein